MSWGKANRAWLLALVMIGMGASPALAALLNPGFTLFPAPGEIDPVGGLPVAGPLASPFVAPTFNGTLISTVIGGDASNPWGGLTFTYQLINNAGSANDIERLTVLDFAPALTDASFQIPAIGLPPSFITRSTPDVVGFNFLGPPIGPGSLRPGMASAVLVVQTNSPMFRKSGASVIDGSSVSNIPTFAPLPEPATLAMLGLGGVALLRRWRR